jgi:hypothetical protein
VKKHMNDCTEPELREKFDQAMRWLENHLPAGDGPRGNPLIVLLSSGTFDAGIGQYAANADRATIVANADRATIVAFLREFADTLERRWDVSR